MSEQILKIAKLDSSFLCSKNLMDYSLLLGIEYIDLEKSYVSDLKHRGIIHSETRINKHGKKFKQILYVSLIDYL